MYFNVFSDVGSTIEGYLIPDGFSAKPKIVVLRDGETLGPFACDVFLPGPYNHKHHETGIVGFLLSSETVPGLELSLQLEIADAETGFVFYRRLIPDQHITKRVFRLETQFVPHQELDRSLKPHFQFYATGAERFGSETVRQMLEIAHQPSTYVSGRVLLKSVQRYFTENTISITSFRDPFYEFALRLWSVSTHKRRPLPFMSERDQILYQPAMSYFADLNFSSLDEVKRKVGRAPKDILSLFESPFTHQLVAASPTDKVSRDDISAALDLLSQFSIFIPDEVDDQIVSDITELLAIGSSEVSFSPARSPFLELAEALKDVSILEAVLEIDLILFYFIKRATARARRNPL